MKFLASVSGRHRTIPTLAALLAACASDPALLGERNDAAALHDGAVGDAGDGEVDALDSGTSSNEAGANGTDIRDASSQASNDASTSHDDAAIDEPKCTGGRVVHFVYFVEADATFSEAQRADVERQAFAFQQYWHDQLGVTFYLSEPVVDVIMADHAADWYLTTPDGIHDDLRWYRLGSVKKEVYAKLGIADFDPVHRVVNYPTSRHDGRVGANFGGAWMDGDDLACIHDNGFNYPYDDANPAHCTGHVAHEFGHVLGLPHQGPNDDCMQYGFYTNDSDDLCDFSSDNVAQILADPDNDGWFEARPGETCGS